MKRNTIQIDGSRGEGGGQVLRSALSLSLMTGKAFRMKHIRAKRSKPGLMRQHLTAVCAAAAVGHARVEGCELASQELYFEPGDVCGGGYCFQVGTAGSVMLVLQTVLLPLLFAKEASVLELEGGTHNSMAPSYDFIEQVYLPLLRRMGGRVEVKLERAGFYPAGQGRVLVRIEPVERLLPLDLLERGPLLRREVVAAVGNLPLVIARRELEACIASLDLGLTEVREHEHIGCAGPGNVLHCLLEYEYARELFIAFGEKGTAAEGVARQLCKQVKRYDKANAPVGDFLADQLLLPMAVVGAGRFRTLVLSEHFKTNWQVIEKFLPVELSVQREDRLQWLVEIKKRKDIVDT